ncbi:MAG TPA: hypothetical protein V6C86_02155 [Oculatellaceae cyanobacterium]
MLKTKLELPENNPEVTKDILQAFEINWAEVKRILRVLEEDEITTGTVFAEGAAKLAAFLYICCFIDFVAGFAFRNEESTGRFNSFVTRYLVPRDPAYRNVNLYSALRCGLVHSLSPYDETGERFLLVDDAKTKHLTISNGVRVLRLQDFAVDVRAGFLKWISEVNAPAEADSKNHHLINLQYFALEHSWLNIGENSTLCTLATGGMTYKQFTDEGGGIVVQGTEYTK